MNKHENKMTRREMLRSAGRVDFLAAIQRGFGQLDRGEGIPHEELKRQLASWLTN